jgi:hypothetical protein
MKALKTLDPNTVDSPHPASRKGRGRLSLSRSKVQLQLAGNPSSEAKPAAKATPELFKMFKQRGLENSPPPNAHHSRPSTRKPLAPRTGRDSDAPSASPTKERPPSSRRREPKRSNEVLENVSTWFNGLLGGGGEQVAATNTIDSAHKGAGQSNGPSSGSTAAPARAGGVLLDGGWTAFVDQTSGLEYAVSPGWTTTTWIQRVSEGSQVANAPEVPSSTTQNQPMGGARQSGVRPVTIPVEKPEEGTEESARSAAPSTSNPFWTWTQAMKSQLAKQESVDPDVVFQMQVSRA